MPLQLFQLSTGGTWTPNGVSTVVVAPVAVQKTKVNTAILPLTMVASDSDPVQRITWSATNLPTGLAIAAATGIITGTPTAVSSPSVIVTATDTAGSVGSATFAWQVAATNVVTVLPVGRQTSTAGTAITPIQARAVDSDAAVTAFTWSLLNPPPGIVIGRTTGVIAGTPTASGISSTSVSATDPLGVVGTVGPLTWTVNAAGALRFAGDPGPGRYYFGANRDAPGLDAWLTAKSPGLVVSMERCGYGAPFGPTGGLKQAEIQAVWNLGHIAQWSYSGGELAPNYTYANIAAGTALVNTMIDADAAWLNANVSATQIIWISWQHEPDCKNPILGLTAQADFRNAGYYYFTRLKSKLTANAAQYVAFIHVYTCGSLWNGTLNFQDWCIEWSGTAWKTPICDAWGTDLYNPSVGSVKRFEPDATIKNLFADLAARGPVGDVRPLIMGEMGIKSHDSIPDPKAPGGSRTWTLNDLFRYMDDWSGAGRPGSSYAGRQLVGWDLWNMGDPNLLGVYPVVDATNAALNPNGWPDSGYSEVHDPDGIELVYTGTVTGGTFTITYTPPAGSATTSAAIAATPTPAQLTTGLNSLTGVAAADFYVHGTWNGPTAGLPLTVHWTLAGAHYRQDMNMVINSSVTGGGSVRARHTNKRGAIREQVSKVAGMHGTGAYKVFNAPPGSPYV